MVIVNIIRVAFAALWLVIAMIIFVYQATLPADSQWGKINMGGVTISVGWAALLLGVYNFFRWYSARAALVQKKRDREYDEAREARLKALRQESQPPAEPNPDFDFNKK
jgi:hypothetical protein